MLFHFGKNHPLLSGSTLALGFVLFLMPILAPAAVPMSQDACKRLSEGAKISKTKALIIGYEGLFSSSPINANLLSSYRDKLATGKKASRPLFLFGGSFLTRGPLTKIVEKYKNKVQVLVFGRTGRTGADSVPGKCATIWMQDKGEGTEGRKVIIVGHSFGGGAAWELANSLRSKGVQVDSVVTADPRSPKQCMGECWNWAKPSNVTHWSNHYQLMPLKGHKVPGASNYYHGNYSHGTVQNAPALFQAIANRIDGVNGPLTVSGLEPNGNGAAGNSGALNPSKISGTSKDAANPPPGKQQGPATPLKPASSSILSAFARNSPSRNPGSAEEKAWMDRHSEFASSGGSGLAKKGESTPGIFTYYKPGSGAPLDEKGGSRPVQSGSSLPGNGIDSNGEQAIVENGSALPSSANGAKAANGTTAMLNKLWPLSKGEASLPHLGSGYGSSSGSTSSSASPLAALSSNSFEASRGSIPSLDSSAENQSPSDELTHQAAPADQAQASVSLFRRVHKKHELWLKQHSSF